MSGKLYSGFKSKSNELYYDKMVFKLIQLLSYQVKRPCADYEKFIWVRKLVKVSSVLAQMESASEQSV